MTATPDVVNPVRERPSRPLLNRTALSERWREWNGGHEAEASHAEHLSAALDWIVRAQQSTGCGGIARGYGLKWDSYFGASGWQPAYPETTGYIIPTLYAAAERTGNLALATNAEQAARWEQDIQLPTGAVRGGVIGQPVSPAVFNTGQVIFGWLAALQRTSDPSFAESAQRAAAFLVSVMDTDGIWRQANSRFALRNATLYNARTAWALAEAGRRLGMPECTEAAARHLAAVASRQHDNGWIPECCLTDPERPLLHTIAYAIRGMLEGGRILNDERLITCAATAASAIAETMSPDGTLPGRFTSEWKRAAPWSCLTGEAQMGGVWLRLFEITNDRHWLEPVPAVIQALKRTQNRTSEDPGLRGGIKGSGPLGGGYGPYQVLSWATKFFADLLLRDDAVRAAARPLEDDMLLLA